MDRGKGLNEVERPFTFAVVGDTHFALPRSPDEADEGRPVLRPLAAEQYAENVNYALSPMMEAIKADSPAFVVMTGDFVEGHQDESMRRAEMQAGLDFFDSLGIPLLIARGNQDRHEVFSDTVLPYLSRGLGWQLEESHYFTDVAGCRLVVLDTTRWKRDGEQSQWLTNLLEQSKNSDVDRTFVFGHHPIWPIARAFFTNLHLHRELPAIFEQYPIDAYFCGHTHNQSAALHLTGSEPVLQFMGAPIGLPEEMPTPLNRVQALLPPLDQLLACWPGYLENTAPGWFMVRVGRRSTTVEWHHLNRTSEVRVRWRRRGDITSFSHMAYPADAQMITSDLVDVRRAYLRVCAWDAMHPGKRVILNGREIGDLPGGSQFSPKRLELPDSSLAELRMVNRLEIQAPEDEASTLGNLVLEALLPGGRLVRTEPTGEIYTWSDRWDAWQQPTLVKLEPGEPIAALLSFR